MELIITKPNFEKIKHQTLIIDVRNNWEHQELKKLPNSVNIPFLELISKPENYITDKNKLVITYCNYGNRSGQAARMLRERGYKQTFVLEGGIENYFSKN
ncbi:rhodanese-like domain-containing protein [endosymbiont GvMRE of Glomus versiforme]|uniref:rhodanese-like domain-containing protein n=1 Tax=endosymbiont GvMRE of Glomus versiforme TaxID=2039283 RepID=UPI000EC33704|nr:rhodanese-like domain-containing protein [endosymbiont GvMRE of Glomus versiforme]RHZ37216.1 Rhodanese-related sulfurtransferase [endosymbiont GvMRE of Glomus versiforme]